MTDLGLPDLDGAEVARAVKAHRPGARVLFLTMNREPKHVAALLEAWSDCYLLKHSAFGELAAAVRAVTAAKALVGHLRRDQRRERQVLARMAAGDTSKGAAYALGLSAKAIENYRARILEKLEVTNTAEAVAHALRDGLLDRVWGRGLADEVVACRSLAGGHAPLVARRGGVAEGGRQGLDAFLQLRPGEGRQPAPLPIRHPLRPFEQRVRHGQPLRDPHGGPLSRWRVRGVRPWPVAPA